VRVFRKKYTLRPLLTLWRVFTVALDESAPVTTARGTAGDGGLIAGTEKERALVDSSAVSTAVDGITAPVPPRNYGEGVPGEGAGRMAAGGMDGAEASFAPEGLDITAAAGEGCAASTAAGGTTTPAPYSNDGGGVSGEKEGRRVVSETEGAGAPTTAFLLDPPAAAVWVLALLNELINLVRASIAASAEKSDVMLLFRGWPLGADDSAVATAAALVATPAAIEGCKVEVTVKECRGDDASTEVGGARGVAPKGGRGFGCTCDSDSRNGDAVAAVGGGGGADACFDGGGSSAAVKDGKSGRAADADGGEGWCSCNARGVHDEGVRAPRKLFRGSTLAIR